MTNTRENPKISLVMPAYDEEESIGLAIDGFRGEFESKDISYEIVVVDNNSLDKTAEIALQRGARVVKEDKQGYGYACMRALREALGEKVVLVEGDNTFNPGDIWKILVYLDEKDIDLVLGTRTTLELVEEEAKMDWLLQWGNIFLAKFIQLQFWGRVRLTDVGCTFRGIKRDALLKVLDKFRVGGPCFSPEMIIWCLKEGLKPVEIPVRYMKRMGQSKITANRRKSIIVGLKMFWLILTQAFWKK